MTWLVIKNSCSLDHRKRPQPGRHGTRPQRSLGLLQAGRWWTQLHPPLEQNQMENQALDVYSGPCVARPSQGQPKHSSPYSRPGIIPHSSLHTWGELLQRQGTWAFGYITPSTSPFSFPRQLHKGASFFFPLWTIPKPKETQK